MNGHRFYDSLFGTVLNGLDDDMGVAVVKHYHHSLIEKEVAERVVEKSPLSNAVIIYHNFKMNDMQSAYMPVMDFIKEYYEMMYPAMKPEEFVDQCGIYLPQREIVTSFLRSGRCTRHEELMYVEAEYEQGRFCESIAKMIAYMAKDRPIVMVFNDLQYSNISFLTLMRYIIQKGTPSGLYIFATYNEAVRTVINSSEVWRGLITECRSENCIYENIMFEESVVEEGGYEFVPVVEKMPEYTLRIYNMMRMLANEQALYYLDIINQKIEREKLVVSDSQLWKLRALSAVASLFSGDFSKALLYCEKMNKCSDYTDDLLCENDLKMSEKVKEILMQGYAENYISARIHILTASRAIADMCADKCIAIAQKLADWDAALRARILKFFAKYNEWINVYDIVIEDLEGVDEVLKDIYNAGYINSYAYISSYAYNNDVDSLLHFVNKTEGVTTYDKAIDIGMKMDNQKFLLVATIKNVILCSEYGMYGKVEGIYNDRIVNYSDATAYEDEGDRYNGLGYNYAVTEQYVKASDCFEKSLNIFLKHRAPHKAAETLYNMGLNYIAAEEYDMAAVCVEQTLKIMEYLNIHEIVICSEMKLYAMLALCEYYTDVKYNCYSYLSRIEFSVRDILKSDGSTGVVGWDEILVYYYIVEALIKESEGDDKGAKASFEKAQNLKDKLKRMTFIVTPLLATERARHLRKTGENDEARRVLKHAMDECYDKGFKMKAGKLAALMEKESVTNLRRDLYLPKELIKEVDDMAKTEAMGKELEEKNKHTQMLIMWQDDIRGETKSAKRLINNSMKTLTNVYDFEGALYVSMEDGQTVKKYEKNMSVSEEGMEKLLCYLNNKPLPLMVRRSDSRYFDYRGLFDLLNIKNVECLVCIPLVDDLVVNGTVILVKLLGDTHMISKKTISEGELTIIKWMCIHLADAVERIHILNELEGMNDRLKRISVTDSLTGIYNRQGLEEIMEKEVQKSKRESDNSGYLCYFDLDNFKYYNDNFGHAVGDVLLIRFAEMLSEMTKECGYAIRYGGDEFITILPRCGFDVADGVAKGVQKLINERFSAGKLSKLCGKDIPTERLLTSSIGVAKIDGYRKSDVEEAMKKADMALYEVKRTTKNGIGYAEDCSMNQ